MDNPNSPVTQSLEENPRLVFDSQATCALCQKAFGHCELDRYGRPVLRDPYYLGVSNGRTFAVCFDCFMAGARPEITRLVDERLSANSLEGGHIA